MLTTFIFNTNLLQWHYIVAAIRILVPFSCNEDEWQTVAFRHSDTEWAKVCAVFDKILYWESMEWNFMYEGEMNEVEVSFYV